jgi:hypothetical protein
MQKRGISCLFLIISIFLFVIVSAENITDTNLTENQSANLNVSIPIEMDEIYLVNFFPTETEVGDVQFNIRVRNDGNDTLNNIIAFISGKGYSSYDLVSIDSLAPGEKSYIIVYGNLKESGNINLTIRIDRQTFYTNISVINPNEQALNDAEKEQRELENISQQIEELKSKYASLELEISEKNENDYDVSSIKLDDLKKYIRNAEASIYTKELKDAKSNLNLAIEEYDYQKNKVDNAKLVPTINKVKDYAIIFSAIAGSIIAFFAVYELLIRKSLVLARLGKSAVVKVVRKKKRQNNKQK